MSRPFLIEAHVAPCVAAPVSRITFEDLARLPAQRLARLLLDRAAEDPTLLSRLYDTIDQGSAPAAMMRRSAAVGGRPVDMNLGGDSIVGESVAMRRVTALISRFGQTDDPVLITGESGTGKELLAQAIHRGSRRRHGPFVALNCAAIAPGLVASELFGCEKGAFTGATARNLGQIEHADGGTFFLDEIGDMPIELQGHLLRFLQERQIRRVGGRETINLDVRVVSATNVRLDQAIAEGRFREDLFYRLNVMTVPVPPLRDRRDDIVPLATCFLRLAAQDFNRRIDGFTPDAVAALLHNRWPGNVRELKSVIRRAVAVGDSARIDMADLIGLSDPAAPAEPRGVPRHAAVSSREPPARTPCRRTASDRDLSAMAPARAGSFGTSATALAAAWDASFNLPATAAGPASAPMPKPGSPEERAALLTTLERTGENITSAAVALGVSRVTLYRMLRRHGTVLRRGMAQSAFGDRGRHARS